MKGESFGLAVLSGMLLLMFTAPLIGIGIANYNHHKKIYEDYKNNQVTEKEYYCTKTYTTDERISKHSSQTHYYIGVKSGEDYQIFEFIDIPSITERPLASLYAHVEVGKTYKIKTLQTSEYDFPIVLNVK